MNLIFRLLYTLLFSRNREPVSILGPCNTPFRCWWTDLDVLRHMNNGKYFSVMDLARIDTMMRAGVFKKLFKRGWYPVVASETIRFRKSLKLFDRFTVETSILAWDDKSFFVQQRFMRGEDCVTESVVLARFLKKSGGFVSPKEILEISGITNPSPPIPQWLQNWKDGVGQS